MTLQLSYVKLLMKGKSDSEIVERLKRLETIGKGEGFPMYDTLVMLLEEDTL